MCGIVGILSQKPVAAELYESLLHLQHRGQDTAGILTFDEKMHSKIGRGRASEVFQRSDMDELTGNMGIAHLRYPTRGSNTLAEAQPLMTTYPYGMGLVHNGNLVNYKALQENLKSRRRYINSTSDSELILHCFADFMAQHPVAETLNQHFEHICSAVSQLFAITRGAYSIIISIVGLGMVAFRDPHGIRPLAMAEREHNGIRDYCFASEDIPFYSLGFTRLGDVLPGEVVFVSLEGQLFRKRLEIQTFRPCVFEYVYFARPDGVMNNISVYRTRLHMGENLAHAWRKRYPQLTPDVVVPIPFTSNTPALAFANVLGVRYCEGLYKNPFIGRTFIMATQEKRVKSVRTKLHPQITELKNKKVLLLDDSIVRGTTAVEIIKMVREAGAKEIYLVSACPPVKFPCYYGINIPTAEELIANQCESEAAIAKVLGVDALLYQEIKDLQEAVLRRRELHAIESPCMACLNGDYVCGRSDSL